MKKLIIFLCLGLLFLSGGLIQSVDALSYNKQEFRGIWVATVANIDIGRYQTKAQYQKDFIEILDTIESYHFNALIFQVRPTSDAFYLSKLNPWSRYLTGVEGQSPGWDILSWMIEETKKRGISFHAWLNPYRVSLERIGNKTKDALLKSLSKKNFAYKHPDYVLVSNENEMFLNPGQPAVKQFIIDTIEEIISNYNVDGIHLDDYFYPYSGVKENSDEAIYQIYKKEGESLGDFRRRNVNDVVKGIKDIIDKTGLEIQFGISPFGIWRNQTSDPKGSNTRGTQSYDAQFADTRKWVKEEWIDYIAPQLYWEIGHPLADYETLVSWWNDVCQGTDVKLYTGHALYKYGTQSSFMHYKEIPNQILLNKDYDSIEGSIFFSYRHLTRNTSDALIEGRSYIRNHIWNESNEVETNPVDSMDESQSLYSINHFFFLLGGTSILLILKKLYKR